MAHKTVADVIVETLQAAGVKHCWDLVNPDFARVAEAIGFHARRVERDEDLEGAVKDWLAQPGPALLDVVVSRLELVTPSHIEPGQVFGTALYSAKALLGGRAGDVWDLALDNL